jgi:hypothetical protein
MGSPTLERFRKLKTMGVCMEKSGQLAKLLISVGALLTLVPLGFVTVSVISLQPDPWAALMSLGWALIIAIALLPLGLAFLIGGLGWLTVLKRQAKALEESDDEVSPDESAATKN